MKYLRLITAITVGLAAWPFTKNAPITLPGVWSMLMALARFKRASKMKSAIRLGHCANCPLLYKPLMTCGSPLRWKHRELGCWCQMEVKASLPNAGCWLRDEHGLKNYWPDGI